MSKFRCFLIFSILLCCLLACKKDDKPKIPPALVGKWYIRQYAITTSINNIAGSPFVYFHSDTATNVYYVFKDDGTGLEQLNFDPTYISVPAAGFNYHVSGSSMVFSRSSAVLQSATCSFEIPTNNTMVIRSSYNMTDNFGNVINNLQVVNLGR